MDRIKPAVPAVARFFDLPVPYGEATAWQEQLVQARLNDGVPDTVLIMEHEPVITLGASADESHLRLSPAQLTERGIAVVHSARGGDVTWHGPGQLVIYPILKLHVEERDVRGYIERLEETAIRTAATFSIHAWRRPGLTGVWTAHGKLAAIGVRIRRWVTFHGLSFNVAPEPDGFQYIVPCGLAGEPVTSLRALLAPEGVPGMGAVRAAWLQAFESVFNRRFETALQAP